MKSDGLKFWTVDAGDELVTEWTTSTAWDFDNATSGTTYSTAAWETIPVSIIFSSDGLKMFISGRAGDDINEIALTTAWDLSTAAASPTTTVAEGAGIEYGMMSKDGLWIYWIDTNDNVSQNALTVAWDLSTAGANSGTLINPTATGGDYLFTNDDGTIICKADPFL